MVGISLHFFLVFRFKCINQAVGYNESHCTVCAIIILAVFQFALNIFSVEQRGIANKTFLLSVQAVCNPRALNLTFFLGEYYKNLFLTSLKKIISFFNFNFVKLALVIEKTSTLLGQGFRRLFFGTVYGLV